MGHSGRRNDSVGLQEYAQLYQLAELLRTFRPVHLWLLGLSHRIWKLLEAVQRGFQLGALHEWNVDTRCAAGLDLGEQRTLGLDAISLRELAAFADFGMGLGSRRTCGATSMGRGPRELGSRR